MLWLLSTYLSHSLSLLDRLPSLRLICSITFRRVVARSMAKLRLFVASLAICGSIVPVSGTRAYDRRSDLVSPPSVSGLDWAPPLSNGKALIFDQKLQHILHAGLGLLAYVLQDMESHCRPFLRISILPTLP